MTVVSRRRLLELTGAACAAEMGKAQTGAIPIIDTHIHLFDQTRPQGAPYSGGRGNTAPSLPARYRKLATPLGIVGAIAIEASPWLEDNLWLLQVAESDTIMVGVIGNLQPGRPDFREFLDRFHKNKLFLGIRYGNLWGYSLVNEVSNPAFIDGLKLIQQADLALDTANPRPDLMEALLRVSDRVPGLRIIIDHVPNMLRRLDSNARPAVEATLRELSKRESVFIKISEVMQMVGDQPSLDRDAYKPDLDYLIVTFGENKVIFGSDWPNGAAVGNLPAIVRIAQDYFSDKDRSVAEKFFWKNAAVAYKWRHRDASQPNAA